MLSAASAAFAAISFVLVCTRLPLFPDRLSRFFLISIWLRYVMAAFPEFTYRPVAAGFSANALLSLAVIGVGLLLISPRDLLLRRVVPLYPILVLIVVSGAVNHQFTGAINGLLKWSYFLVVAISGFRALERHGAPKLLSALLLSFILPLSSQISSILVGAGKQSAADKSIVYVGSYQHESVFSIIIFTYIIVASLYQARAGANYWRGLLLVSIGIVSLLFANYRTTMLAAAPLIATFLTFGLARRFAGAQKAIVWSILAVAGFVAISVIGSVFQERFQDLLVVFDRGEALIKPPDMFDNADADLFSARLYIWSQYVYAYLNGSDLQMLIGNGPDSWTRAFPLYAHNTYVSYLYEYGIAGIALMLFFCLYQLWQVLYVRDGNQRPLIFAAHVGFLILNMATMPLWQIEGTLLYAILCAYTWHMVASPSPRLSSRPAPAPIPFPRAWNAGRGMDGPRPA